MIGVRIGAWVSIPRIGGGVPHCGVVVLVSGSREGAVVMYQDAGKIWSAFRPFLDVGKAVRAPLPGERGQLLKSWEKVADKGITYLLGVRAEWEG